MSMLGRPIDILVNNAGVGDFVSFPDITEAKMEGDVRDSPDGHIQLLQARLAIDVGATVGQDPECKLRRWQAR